MKKLKTEIMLKIDLKWSTLSSYHCCVRGVSMGIRVDSWGSFTGDKNLSKLLLFLYNAVINFSSSFISYKIPSNAGYFG
jgi:hypothetical protein